MNIKEQCFGMELEFTGITRSKAADAIASVVGGRARYEGGGYRKYAVAAPDGRKWEIMRDSSIDVEYGEACEFVTPKCTYDDIPTVQECIRALRRAGAKVNKSCGLHIHIDGSNHTAKSLKNLLYMFRAKEDLIFKAVGTQRARLGRWCKPITDHLIDNVKQAGNASTEMTRLKDIWYRNCGGYNDQFSHYNQSRYHALNLHSFWYRGTVEFRLFEASLHAGEVRAWINLCLAISSQAINSKRATANILENGNDKYSMRCWLLRLGFIGDEYKTVREHLLKNLSGNAAWRDAPDSYASYRRQRAGA